jgi:hypothetical protein
LLAIERFKSTAGLDPDAPAMPLQQCWVDPHCQGTHCHACGAVLIGHDWYDITAWHLSADGRCVDCGTLCCGVFEAVAGQWGRRRQPVRLRASEPEPMAS